MDNLFTYAMAKNNICNKIKICQRTSISAQGSLIKYINIYIIYYIIYNVSQHGWSLTLEHFWNFEFRMPSCEPRKPKTKLVVNKIATENKIDGKVHIF